ncbi:MAG: HRDC domain-containing protein [Planctomycetaceae bacterium]|nr:HRDC domain-containing protein [Planctomycetaceae bacterium]
MTAVDYQDITTDEQLRRYCRTLSHAKTIAFDTEFVSEHTYRPVLCLVQVCADDQLAVLDAITIGDMTPFWETLAAPGHDTIVHAGRSELEFCLLAIGRRPTKLFDVQLAAAMVGAEYPAGLGTLLTKFLGRTPSKHETRTDWRRRPLSKRQIEYALNDSLFLPALCQTICQQLDSLGRRAWLDEEMETWQSDIERSMSQERWRRVSGNAGMDARGLAILRELFHWRDAEAQRRNQPVRRILRDDLLVELARRGSADPVRIRAVRGMERGDLQHRMDEIAAAIQRGLDLPEAECPPRPTHEKSPELSVLGQFLFAALGSICRESHLAPNLVGTPNDIRDWIAHRMSRSRSKSAAVPQLGRGWRADYVGRLFEDLLSGRLTVRVADPRSGHPLQFRES